MATNDIVCDPKFTLVHSMLTKEQIKMIFTLHMKLSPSVE